MIDSHVAEEYDDALEVAQADVPHALELARQVVQHLEEAIDAEHRAVYARKLSEAARCIATLQDAVEERRYLDQSAGLEAQEVEEVRTEEVH